MFKRNLAHCVVVLIACLAMAAPSFGAAAAADLFKSKCSMCHGMDGKGYPAIHTPDFTSAKWQAQNTDAQITGAIENGVKGTSMPAWQGKLTTAQIHDLVAYIRSLGSGKK
jgi:cytochrome c oxidase cbb3-type subunit III